MTNKNTYLTPHSIEAERAVLGGLMLQNDQWEEISETIDKGDFYKKIHQMIFLAMATLVKNNEPIDVVTLSVILEKEKKINDIGGIKYLNLLIKNTPSAKNISFYAKILIDQSLLRKLIATNKHFIEVALSNKNIDVKKLIDTVEEKFLSLSNIYSKKNKGSLTNISHVLKKTIKNIETFSKSKSHITGLSSGFNKLDNITSGLHPSELIIVAGRPSMGKTALAINIAENIIMNTNLPVLVFSMEMSSEQITTRIIASLGHIHLQKLRNGKLKEMDWPKLSQAVSILSNKNLFIDDSGVLTPFDIKTKARKIYKQHKKIGAIIIDYLQLMKMPGSNDNKVQEISEISRSLKVLAKELDVPIIALSQLNRSLEQRLDRRPIMSDLRESGAIEQDADVIIFIYRDEIYNKNTSDLGIAEIIIAKQRNGPIGNFKLKFFGHYSKFENLVN